VIAVAVASIGLRLEATQVVVPRLVGDPRAAIVAGDGGAGRVADGDEDAAQARVAAVAAAAAAAVSCIPGTSPPPSLRSPPSRPPGSTSPTQAASASSTAKPHPLKSAFAIVRTGLQVKVLPCLPTGDGMAQPIIGKRGAEVAGPA